MSKTIDYIWGMLAFTKMRVGLAPLCEAQFRFSRVPIPTNQRSTELDRVQNSDHARGTVCCLLVGHSVLFGDSKGQLNANLQDGVKKIGAI